MKETADGHFRERLNKNAPPTLVCEIEDFYQKLFRKAARYYSLETGNGEAELSQRKREAYFRKAAVEKGLNPAKMPFRAV
jgi:inorganic triphosphatase YgiF